MIFSKFGFGKTTNRRFNYIPRYYNAEKEEFQSRVERAKKEADGNYDSTDFESRIRSGYNLRSKAYNNTYNDASRKSTIRVILIACILGTIFYTIFNSGLIDRFFLYFQ